MHGYRKIFASILIEIFSSQDFSFFPALFLKLLHSVNFAEGEVGVATRVDTESAERRHATTIMVDVLFAAAAGHR